MTYNVLIHTLAEFPFGDAALPQLLVTAVETFVVLLELVETVCVDILEPAKD